MPAENVLFRPVRAGNAFEETVERLLTAIKLGLAGPGARLPPERELSERLGVSRVTLREAIRALQRSGYVESRRGRYGGTFVRPVLPTLTQTAARRLTRQTGHDLEDTLLLREVLEVGAAEQAAVASGLERGSGSGARATGGTGAGGAGSRATGTRATGTGATGTGATGTGAVRTADRAQLVRCFEDCARASDVPEYRRLDSRFHLAVAEAAGSPSLTAAVADIRMRINGFLDAIPVLERNVAHSERQHARIVDAIVVGDAEAARRAMAEHLSATAALLRGFLA